MTPVNRLLPPYVVRLTIPINRFYEVPSLQHLCKYVIRNKFNLEILAKLPFPSQMMAYIQDDSSESKTLTINVHAQDSIEFYNVHWNNRLVLD